MPVLGTLDFAVFESEPWGSPIHSRYSNSFIYLFTKNILMFVYFWERERERVRVRACRLMQVGEGQRGRQNPKQDPGSQLSAQRLTWGWNSRSARSRRPEPQSDA